MCVCTAPSLETLTVAYRTDIVTKLQDVNKIILNQLTYSWILTSRQPHRVTP